MVVMGQHLRHKMRLYCVADASLVELSLRLLEPEAVGILVLNVAFGQLFSLEILQLLLHSRPARR